MWVNLPVCVCSKHKEYLDDEFIYTASGLHSWLILLIMYSLPVHLCSIEEECLDDEFMYYYTAPCLYSRLMCSCVAYNVTGKVPG